MTSEWRIMPNHPTRKCACWASVKLNAKYCLFHWEKLRRMRWILQKRKHNKEKLQEEYDNLYRYLNRMWFWQSIPDYFKSYKYRQKVDFLFNKAIKDACKS